jgi:hypothetical protein
LDIFKFTKYTLNVYEQPYFNVHVYSSNILNTNNLDIMVLLNVSSKLTLVVSISCIYATANHFVDVYGTPSCFYQVPQKIVKSIITKMVDLHAHMLEMHGLEWTRFFVMLYAHYSVNVFFENNGCQNYITYINLYILLLFGQIYFSPWMKTWG